MTPHERAHALHSAIDVLTAARNLADLAEAYGVSKSISRLLREDAAKEMVHLQLAIRQEARNDVARKSL